MCGLLVARRNRSAPVLAILAKLDRGRSVLRSEALADGHMGSTAQGLRELPCWNFA